AGTRPTGAPGKGVQDVELRGEYPSASLRYIDPDLPLEVRMETFTPWVPLDARVSAMPATVFLFRLRNPGREAVKVSLLAALHNAAALGQPGGNFNEAFRGEGLAGVRLAVRPGRPPRLDRRADLVALVPGFALPETERPAELSLRTPRYLAALPDDPRA